MDQKIVVLSYVDDCVYWYTNEDLGNGLLISLVNIFHVNFLWYAHWFMSKRISQLKDHSISVDQARYATYIVAKYLDTATVTVSTNFYKTTFPAEMMFTKEEVSTSDEKVGKLTREYNIQYRACIGSLIFLTRTLQWNLIDDLLLYVWLHLLRNISKSSWKMLVTKYLQQFTFCEDLL